MYEKSFWLVDFLYVLVIHQYNQPFKIIHFFNYYKMLSLTSGKERLLDPENDAIHLLVMFVNTKA